MKRIIIILVLFASYSTIGQIRPPFVNNQSISNEQTIYHAKGALKGDISLMLPVIDTLDNPATPFSGSLTVLPSDATLDSFPIYISNGRFWFPLNAGGAGGGGTIGLDTVYVTDDLYVTWDSTTHGDVHQVIHRYHSDGLMSGTGIVTWISGLTFAVTPAQYWLNRVFYTSPADTITLDTSDPTNPRIDVIAVDTTGIVIRVTGTAAATPLTPPFNTTAQLSLTSILIDAGATTPSGVSLEQIYFEGVEWDTTSSGTITINFRDISNPLAGTYATYVSSYGDGSKIIFIDNAVNSAALYEVLNGAVYLNGELAPANALQFQFFNGTTAVSNNLSVHSGYGINPLDSNVYQPFSIPFSAFTFPNSYVFDRLVITHAGDDLSGTKGYYIDNIMLQQGINNPSPLGDFVDSVTIVAGSDYYWINGMPTLIGPRSGGTGNPNSNIGSGYRLAVPNTNNVKTLFNGYAIGIDSASNTDALTFKLDTTLALTKLGAVAIYQPLLTLTTTGSGAATFASDILNIPTPSSSVGTVTSFSSGNLSPLFTTSVATATSTPALSFTLSNAAAYTNFGNNTASTAAPSFFTNNFSDSLRRIGVVVSRRVNSVWIPQYNDSLGSGTNVDSTIRAKNVLTFTSAVAFGDSYTAGYGLTSPTKIYTALLSTKYGFTLNNYAISGTSINMLSWQNYRRNAVYNISNATFSLYGFNDLRSSFNQTKRYNKIENAYRAAIANQFLNFAIPANHASITQTGSWSTVNTATPYGGKAVTLSGLGVTTSTTNDQLSYTTTSDNIVIGFIGGDGVNKILGRFLVTIGALVDTVECNNLTDGISQGSDSATFFGLSCVKIYSGLGTASKSVILKNLGGEVIFDYLGTLKTVADSCKPFFITSIQKVNLSGWNVSGYIAGSSAGADMANGRIKYVIAEIKMVNKNYPVYFIDANKYINYNTDLQADSLHWNDLGHQRAYISYTDFLNKPLSTYGAIDQPTVGADLVPPGYMARTYQDNFDFSYLGLLGITSGLDNIAIGKESEKALTTASQNVALGNYTLKTQVTGLYNVAIGTSAMELSRDASGNTAVGTQALRTHKTGANNTAVGLTAMTADTSGVENTSVGYSSLAANTNGAYNTAVGSQALFSNKTGLYNSAVGKIALNSNVSGAQNAALGMGALYASLGSGNTGVGYNAGSSITSGSNNTILGNTALPGITTGSNNTIIGANITGLSASLANYTIVGDGSGNRRFISDGSGRMGLDGNMFPSAGLHLKPGLTTAGNAPLKFTYNNIATTAASGTGTVVTLTFAAQPFPPFAIGSTIVVAGVTPVGYNGTWTVSSSTTTTVTFPTTATGAQTVAGTIAQGVLLTTPEAGSVEYDGTNAHITNSTATRFYITKTLTNTATLDFPSTATGVAADLTITVTGAVDGDAVSIGVPNASITATGQFTAWVSGANTVTIRYIPHATEDPASGVFRASVIKY